MFIPLRTETVLRRSPMITPILVMANIGIYIIMFMGAQWEFFSIERFIQWGWLNPGQFRPWQLVTYQFLHDPGSIWHLLFNMLFLWVFGAAVEDRMGRIGFACFFILGGIAAGLGQMLVSNNPVIGASGSVTSVTGAFLVLFPKVRIRTVLWFFLIGIYSIPAAWFIGLYFFIDVANQFMGFLGRGASNVAYMAHICGGVFGFTVAFLLLATGVIKSHQVDLFHLFKQSRRRANMRAAVRESQGGVWDVPISSEAPARRKSPKQVASSKYAQQRSRIIALVRGHDIPEAARQYKQLLQEDPTQTLPAEIQLDVANMLFAQEDHETAATAYQLLLDQRDSGRFAVDVKLALSILLIRHLDQPTRGLQLLEGLDDRIRDPKQQQLILQLREEAGP
ncbi:MAG: hypothetical protein CMJ32_08760 [Phycisphaerae bacterium]|nr:hypothetical protein [Phycisphaerae bacterium]